MIPCCVGGRGVVVGPILSQARSDVFCDNENGPNFLFKNNGDGTFVDRASQAGECETGSEDAEGRLCRLTSSYRHRTNVGSHANSCCLALLLWKAFFFIF